AETALTYYRVCCISDLNFARHIFIGHIATGMHPTAPGKDIRMTTTGPAIATDPALDRDRAVLRYLLDTYAQSRPDAPFVHFWPGPEWSYAQTLKRVRIRATTLARAGVKRGDHVLCLMGNGP